ncbi:MAG: aminoglycoside 6-adenylyltransferase [Chloroflexi bacterium]|nr:MAG: aminoglycoside 6-adenylyltransferase [Chloroflexota bacterium]
MRAEQEIINLALNIAMQDERVRAVVLNGSRANPNTHADIFQDYDIAFLVTEMESFWEDNRWIDVFGERMILQMPEDMELFPAELDGSFTYLMQFIDGTRIDLALVPMEKENEFFHGDSLTVLLLDKDNRAPDLPPPTDKDYLVKPPTAGMFADCCNEFWWVSIMVAKGLWRKETTYALESLNKLVRPMLFTMLEWQIGTRTEFSVNVGKFGKYLEKYLPENCRQEFLSTFSRANDDEIWNALFTACGLFRRTAIEVADHFGYLYPLEDDSRVSAFLLHIQELPPGALSF